MQQAGFLDSAQELLDRYLACPPSFQTAGPAACLHLTADVLHILVRCCPTDAALERLFFSCMTARAACQFLQVKRRTLAASAAAGRWLALKKAAPRRGCEP